MTKLHAEKRGYTESLRAFYGPFEKAVRAKDKLPKAISLGDAPMEFPCPALRQSDGKQTGRGGIFMSYKKYPACLGARSEAGAELMGDEPIGNHPNRAPVYVKTGRFGPYVEMALQKESTKHEAQSTKKES